MTIELAGSVGTNGLNRSKDVESVQTALRRLADVMFDPPLHPGPADGKSGEGTEGAIESFQRRLGFRKPDARIDPGGTTLARLNAWLVIGDLTPRYPFATKSTFSFFGSGAGMRAFGSRRDDGARAHAGIDLYFPDFTPVLAMADGIVTRGPYDFYLKTRAIEIDHGPVLARYGELAPEPAPLVKEGDRVRRGQKIGRVGILTRANGTRLGVPSMMLHLETYDKTETGKLTRADGTSARNEHGVPFKRRQDLMDPTALVRRARMR